MGNENNNMWENGNNADGNGNQYTDPNQGYQYQNDYQNNYNYQNNYQNGYYQQRPYNENERPMTLGEWVLTILVLAIPCVGFIFYIVWAVSKNGNVNRRNYCRAMIIITAIAFVLYFIVFAAMGFGMISTVGSIG